MAIWDLWDILTTFWPFIYILHVIIDKVPKVGRVWDLNPGLNTQERNKTQIYFFIDVNNTNSIPGFPFSALSFIVLFVFGCVI